MLQIEVGDLSLHSGGSKPTVYFGTRDRGQQSHSDTFLMILQKPIKFYTKYHLSQKWTYMKSHMIISRYLPESLQ